MLKNYNNLEKKLLLTGVILLALVVIVSWFTPLAFSAYKKTDSLVPIWLFITNSAVKTGTITSVIITGVLLSLFQISFKKGIIKLFVFVIPVLIALKIFADINHYVTKPLVGLYRPSFYEFAKKDIIDINKLYEYESSKERESYLLKQIEPAKTRAKIDYIHPDVLDHWIHTTGFSFPSGHAQNVFILCTLMSYTLLVIFNGKKYLFLAFIPISWAVLVALSRVALGVHTALDITVGSISGFLIAYLIILSGLLQKIFSN